jgi:hypothetical protein
VEDSAPAGKGLGDLLHEQGILRTCEHKSARGWVPVHAGLDIGKEGWSALHLINDRRTRIASEEPARVLPGKQTHVSFLQRHLDVLGKRSPGERRFSRLPWPRHGQHGAVVRVA